MTSDRHSIDAWTDAERDFLQALADDAERRAVRIAFDLNAGLADIRRRSHFTSRPPADAQRLPTTLSPDPPAVFAAEPTAATTEIGRVAQKRGPGRALIRNLPAGLSTFSALVIGSVAAVVQLTGAGSGLGRVLLSAIGVACLLYTVIRFWHLYFIARIQDLSHELTRAHQHVALVNAGHQRYVDAIDSIIHQEGPLFRESLELTVVVGADDHGDTIVERRYTIPKPHMAQRAFRPILPAIDYPTLTLEDLDLKVSLLGEAGSVEALPIYSRQQLRLLLLFNPALTNPVDWEIRYRPHGMWAPLRSQGHDHLIWTDRLPTSGDTSVMDELTVRFVFPARGHAPRVAERHGFGEMVEATRIEGSGQWLIEWRDPLPAGRRYEWDLAQPPADREP